MDYLQNKTALVTGASSGIGFEIVKYLSNFDMQIIITARREGELIKLKEEVESTSNSNVIVIAKDLAKPNSPQEIYDFCQSKNYEVEFLVNNAGYGFTDDFHSYDLDKLDDFLNVLLNSVVKLTRLFLKDMKERKSGKILQVSSIAGIIPSGSGAIGIYGNIKNFINEFTITLNSTYKEFNVHVCALCPGFTETGFNERAGFNMQYSDVPSPFLMTAKQVAEQGVKACLKGKEIYVVRGGFNKTMIFISKFIPNKVLRFLFGSLVNFGK